MLCKCRICKKSFSSPIRSFACADCEDANEQIFSMIEEYLMQFPNSNAIQISDFLKIRPEIVLSFVEEGRISYSKGHFNKIK